MVRDWLDTFFFRGEGYQFWSGVGSGSPVFAALLIWFRHHNCREQGCWRLGHPHPVTHLPACRRHHPHA